MDSRLTLPIASMLARISRPGFGAALEVTWKRFRVSDPSNGTVANFFAICSAAAVSRSMKNPACYRSSGTAQQH